ncbi:hypothetical protein [Pseudomonas sp. Fl4BN1]|uniref:hypothetical protein n=1 Tax=Pseudomonas sp. Fl4BN1 TaxID=2697651 RepID=UPI001378F5CF|nr:hypothetical protein [Pseudomonas sp. Fl4BN1]NBF13379.1 hypothetical protein [Pseudomonas sp. Fl4BN1]
MFAVIQRLGVKPNEVIDIRSHAALSRVMLGIIIHENGGDFPIPGSLCRGDSLSTPVTTNLSNCREHFFSRLLLAVT